jgi:hypothetical protein
MWDTHASQGWIMQTDIITSLDNEECSLELLTKSTCFFMLINIYITPLMQLMHIISCIICSCHCARNRCIYKIMNNNYTWLSGYTYHRTLRIKQLRVCIQYQKFDTFVLVKWQRQHIQHTKETFNNLQGLHMDVVKPDRNATWGIRQMWCL